MKIIVLVRTRDEAHRIAQFCEAYKDADKILVADGGSVDNTIKIAKTFPNVEVRNYPVRVQMQNGYWRNPDGEHVNWLIAWSKEYDADWVILDDCDCLPNYKLKEDYRKILEETDQDFILVTRFYLWGLDQHFLYLSKPGEGHVQYEPSLWAWRSKIDFWVVPVPPAFTFRIGGIDIKDLHTDTKALDLFPPYALLHKSWDDPGRVQQKVKTYRESGLIPGQLHPLQYGSPLVSLPDFLHE